MRLLQRIRNSIEVIGYTVFAMLLIIITVVVTIRYMYEYSEQVSVEKLKMETEQLRDEISLQLVSDIENLQTMASFASKLNAEGYGYELVFDSFREIGLFENIGILLPDNTMITKNGTVDVSGAITFDNEAVKGEYISGRVNDLIAANKEMVRCAVPIERDNGEIIGIMYGVITLNNLEDRYREQVEAHNAYFIVLESQSGNFIADSKNYELGNITRFENIEYQDGFSYNKMTEEIVSGKSGQTVFEDRNGTGFLYVCYTPLDFADWCVMLAHPESMVFDGAISTVRFTVTVSAIIILIMLGYILLVFLSMGRLMRINACAADIRRNLLEINKKNDSLVEALRITTIFAKARSAFIIDPYSDECHYILPQMEKDQLLKWETEYFNEKLLMYVARHRNEHGAKVYLSKIVCDKTLREEMPDLYEFMVKHKMDIIRFSVVLNNNNTYIVGIVNPGKKYAEDILKKTAVCFSLAMYTRGHIDRTETMALTDSLTGAANRMAYNNDVNAMREDDQYICIYIDVNELHVINNTYGHTAGDKMLVYISDVLRETFDNCTVYRMGGDEFLVFCKMLDIKSVEEKVNIVNQKVESMKYHISVGIKESGNNISVDEVVNGAEKIMYENKLKYYEEKGKTLSRVPRL